MKQKVKSIVANNKSYLITGISSSIFTLLIIGIFFYALVNWNVISFDTSGINLANQTTKPIATGTAAEESRLINTIDKSNSAVVSIIITKNISTTSQNQSYDLFSQLFGLQNQTENQNNSTEEQEVGGGSGFFVSSNGYIVTNNHVVSDKEADYTVVTKDGKKYTAEILATDSTLDIAIVKISGKNFPYLSFANSNDIKIGQTVIAIGNALSELQNTVTTGIVSGLSRSITATDGSGSSEQLSEVIQTDAAINPGNSGGPLLDIKGNVIGVNVALQSDAENIGFALPSNLVKSAVDSYMKNGEIFKPYLGVRYVQINDSVAKANNLSVDYGVLVSKGASNSELAVISGSPADKAGIVENDIILEIDGVKIDENKSLASIIQQKKIGQTVKLKILHQNKEKQIEVKLEKLPKNT